MRYEEALESLASLASLASTASLASLDYPMVLDILVRHNRQLIVPVPVHVSSSFRLGPLAFALAFPFGC